MATNNAPEQLGEFQCDCCCGGRREYDDLNCELGYMRCQGCGCSRVRMGSATQLLLRIQIAGVPSIQHIEKAAELARALGAPDDVALKQSGQAWYFEIAGQGASVALDIAKLRSGQ